MAGIICLVSGRIFCLRFTRYPLLPPVLSDQRIFSPPRSAVGAGQAGRQVHQADRPSGPALVMRCPSIPVLHHCVQRVTGRFAAQGKSTAVHMQSVAQPRGQHHQTTWGTTRASIKSPVAQFMKCTSLNIWQGASGVVDTRLAAVRRESGRKYGTQSPFIATSLLARLYSELSWQCRRNDCC